MELILASTYTLLWIGIVLGWVWFLWAIKDLKTDDFWSNCMRCAACNSALSDYEATRKNSNGDFVDLCNYCFETIKEDVEVENNHDTYISEHDIFDESEYSPDE